MIDYITSLIERHRQRREQRRKADAERVARRVIQLCEYNNQTYISVGGVPIINTTALKGNLYETLDEARRVSATYKIEQR